MKVFFTVALILVSFAHADDTKTVLSEREIYDKSRKFVVMVSTTAHLTADSWGGHSSTWKGSGFILDKKKGLIVTNKHVIGELSVASYEVKFHDGMVLKAEYVYADPVYDFGIIRVDPLKIPTTATEGEIDQDPLKVNEPIYSIGNSAGDEFSVHKGIVFSMYENLGPFSEQSFQFSGITVGGASGSPIIGENNKVKGILYGGAFVSGAGLPISYVSRVLKSIQEDKDPKRYSVGAVFTYDKATDSMDGGLIPKTEYDVYKKEFTEAGDKIIKVSTRLKNTPAFEKLQSGDIIYKVNGKLIGPQLFLLDDVIDEAGKNGKTVKLSLFRGNKSQEVELKPYLMHVDSDFDFIHFGGALWSDASEKIVLRTGIAEGVFVLKLDPTSIFKFGSESGYFFRSFILVQEIDGNPIKSLSDLEKILPNVMKKKIFNIKYLKIDGYESRMYGETIMDQQPRLELVKYNDKYDTPKIYKRDEKTKEWESKIIGATK